MKRSLSVSFSDEHSVRALGFWFRSRTPRSWRGAPVGADRDAFHWELAYLGHESALKGDLSAIENLRFACALRTRPQPGQLRAALDLVGLGALDPTLPVRILSAGQKRRVALARLWLWNAKLWLLDEPGTNLDAAGQAVLEKLLVQHLGAGGSAIVATHRMIELHGDSATGRTICHNPMVLTRPDGQTHVFYCGLWYVDELVRTPQGWRIRKRVEEKCYFHNVPPDFAVQS